MRNKHMRIRVTDQQATRRRPGYVLLAVLAVIVLMVTVLATLSKLSLRRALAAADAQIRLQQRLGADSIERAVLPQAADVFDRLEDQADAASAATGEFVPVPTQVRSAVTIGGVTFDVVLADEDAKLNLNQVYHLTDLNTTRSKVASLLGPNARPAIRLLPAIEPMRAALIDESSDAETIDEADSDPDKVPRAFRCWGEVFDLPALSARFGNDAALPIVTGNLTCWGGGGLNLRRASEQSIKAAATCVLSQTGADQLISRYRENTTMSREILVQLEANSETERMSLRKMLGESSTHFSLWVDASATARRSWRTFSVMRRSDEAVTISERFSF